MKSLYLDLGTKTGWAIRIDGKIQSGVADFKNGRFDGGGMRYLKFRKWLTETRDNTNFQSIYFEEVRRHAGTDAAHAYGGFMATLTAYCEENTIAYSAVPVGTIKKHITGRGNASKGDMIKAVQEKGHKVTDDNEADAIAILYCVEAT